MEHKVLATRILTIAIAFFVAAGTSIHAQNAADRQASQRQKMIHMAAVRIADQIGVGESQREAFVAMYHAYKKEAAAIISSNEATATDTEAAAEQKIYSDFDKSQKILDLRKSYYTKFRTILSPTQIQQMYNVERSGAH